MSVKTFACMHRARGKNHWVVGYEFLKNISDRQQCAQFWKSKKRENHSTLPTVREHNSYTNLAWHCAFIIFQQMLFYMTTLLFFYMIMLGPTSGLAFFLFIWMEAIPVHFAAFQILNSGISVSVNVQLHRRGGGGQWARNLNKSCLSFLRTDGPSEPETIFAKYLIALFAYPRNSLPAQFY